jgi:hypothetical protein
VTFFDGASPLDQIDVCRIARWVNTAHFFRSAFSEFDECAAADVRELRMLGTAKSNCCDRLETALTMFIANQNILTAPGPK